MLYALKADDVELVKKNILYKVSQSTHTPKIIFTSLC